MVAFLILFLHVLVSPFKTQAQLEAEIVLLRHQSPWQNGHAERLIGSIRRECLDHIVVFGEAHLRRSLPATPATTTNSERICPWGRIRRAVDRCNGSASSLLSPSWAGFTINTAACSFRQAQGVAEEISRLGL
jgi:hypothetical protein